MLRLNYQTVSEKSMELIRVKGAFLNALAGDDFNTMTIGWATIGFVWAKPVLMVAVRKTRHTFDILERSTDFTVSIPELGFQKELQLCGSKSGKSLDKLKECNLKTRLAVNVKTPILDLEGIHYECKIILKSAIAPENLAEDFHTMYPGKDFHTLYFGEIVECYSTGPDSN